LNGPQGYDQVTGLFCDRRIDFPIPSAPTHENARAAAKALLLPFEHFRFENPTSGEAILLAAIFTAIERPFLPVAPMFAVRSSMAGTGKGLIVRCLVRLAFDTTPVLITWGGNNEEFEKRLAALLLQAPAALGIDNANGMLVKGDLLESIITEGRADIRPLGVSQIVKVRSRPLITLTGVNPIITGDMARRSISLDIVPRSADPERDRYLFNPAAEIQRRRDLYLRAAYTAMRAFRLAGRPASGLPAIGSFDDWSHKVRDLVYWLTDYDLSEAFHKNKTEDPRRQGDAGLLAALHQCFGTKQFKGADVLAIYTKVRSLNSNLTGSEQTLREALDDVLGRNVNPKQFGYWGRRVKGAHNGGYMLEAQFDPAANANVYVVHKR
jgi:putative DNA primase/helicase